MLPFVEFEVDVFVVVEADHLGLAGEGGALVEGGLEPVFVEGVAVGEEGLVFDVAVSEFLSY